jgi:hypothetical protein
MRKHFFFVNKKEAKKTLLNLDQRSWALPDQPRHCERSEAMTQIGQRPYLLVRDRAGKTTRGPN